MNEPTRLNVSVSAGSNGPRPRVSRMLTLDMLVDWIKRQELDEFTTKGLIELASKYPTQALPTFRRNFQLMLQRVRAKRKLEQIGEIEHERPEKEESSKSAEIHTSNFEEAFSKAFQDKNIVEPESVEDAKENTEESWE